MRTGIIIKGFAVGVIVGSLAVATAATVKAAPDNASIAYAETYGQAVCATLDDFPTFSGIFGVGQAIMDDGLSARQAGYAVALSVGEFCPRHLPLLQRFSDSYSGDQVA